MIDDCGEKSSTRKRHFCITDEIIAAHPEFTNRSLPSLDARLAITEHAVLDLAAAAAANAIADWGRPTADITHLVLATSACAHAPSPDARLAKRLGLRPAVLRTSLLLHGCSGGCVALRLAKDIAGGDAGARVLVVSADTHLLAFAAPDEAHLETIVVNALFGDGAAAVVVGTTNPRIPDERPIFHMVSSSQTTIEGTEEEVVMRISERGLDYNISGDVPALVRGSIERCIVDAIAPLGLAAAAAGGGGGWNEMFWAMHPGGRAILDGYEEALRLEHGKLDASRRVLSEYGNMGGTTIIFVLDELRRRRREEEDGLRFCEWGAMVGLGPGLTIEIMVLRATGGPDDGKMMTADIQP
uniref:Chalcone/stilbene synthase N-terminal domain-containing protein n=1 Tax=Leersia perrieri TaxID=77586 RepID=A0A0D9XSN2_9ORYZ